MTTTRQQEERTCNKCGEVKPLEEFAVNKERILKTCKQCESKRVLSYYRKFGDYYYRSRYWKTVRNAEEAGVEHDLTYEEFLSVIVADNPENKTCAYCGKTEAQELDEIGAGLSIDHIIPLCYGGYNTLFNITNACRSCNSSKSNKHVLNFYKRSEDFTEERLNALIKHMADTAGKPVKYIHFLLLTSYKIEKTWEERVQAIKDGKELEAGDVVSDVAGDIEKAV
jgi:5-methylcytosine-specific restriction endonuclease McrA